MWKHLPDERLYQDVVHDEAANSHFKSGDGPTVRWWHDFDDAQLTALEEEALANNLDLKIAMSRLKAARAFVSKEKAKLLPSLGADVSLSGSHYGKNTEFGSLEPDLPNVISMLESSVGIRYELDLFGKNKEKLKAAIGAQKALAAEARLAFLNISIAVARAYFDLQHGWAALDLAHDKMVLLHEEYQKLSVLVSRGLKTQQELLLIKNAWFLAQKDMKALKNQCALAHSFLAILLGKNPADLTGLHPVSTRLAKSFLLPTPIGVDLLAKRPDVQAYLWRAQSAGRELNVAQLEFFPNIDLSALVGLQALKLEHFFSPQSVLASITPAIHLPLFMGGRLRANRNAKEAAFEEASHAYNAQLLLAAKEVLDAIRTVNLVHSQVDLVFDAKSAVFERINLEDMRLKAGLISRLELVQMRQSSIEARLQEINIEHAHLLAMFNLIDALGGGFAS